MSEETKEPIAASVESIASADVNPATATTGKPQEAPEKASTPTTVPKQVQAAAPPLTGDQPAAAASKPDVKPAAAAAAKPAAAAAKPVPPKPAAPKPEPWDCDLVRSLKAQYGSGICEAATYAKQNYLVVNSTVIYEILLRMRDDELFDYCVDITAIHYPKREAQFDIVYVLYSFRKNERVRIKTQVKDGEHLRSACSIWPTANWLEREVFDMFGVEFDEHPELKRILMPEGWKGHPLRKDYAILQQDQEWVKNNIGIESAQ